MNFTKPVAVVLLAFVVAFLAFPESSMEFVSHAKESISTFASNLGLN
ncbi:hypothetical protein [Bounagaea algeriensis]